MFLALIGHCLGIHVSAYALRNILVDLGLTIKKSGFFSSIVFL